MAAGFSQLLRFITFCHEFRHLQKRPVIFQTWPVHVNPSFSLVLPFYGIFFTGCNKLPNCVSPRDYVLTYLDVCSPLVARFVVNAG
jgi:hypothetical protein